MSKKKLTEKEIDQALEKLRKSYDDFIIQYMKPFKIKRAFEERYVQALKARIDLTNFITAEFEVIKKLFSNEEEKTKTNTAEQIKKDDSKKKNFADKVIEENQKKIEKYPTFKIHLDASPEVEKLYGTLMEIEKKYWAEIDSAMRKYYPTYFASPRMEFEAKFYSYCSLTSDKCPPRLSRYKSLLLRFPRNYKEMEKEAKNCIIDASLFLHKFVYELDRLKRTIGEKKENTNIIDEVMEYMKNIIRDFRLEEIKEQQEKIQ